MSIYPIILLMFIGLGSLWLTKGRQAVEARPGGRALYQALQALTFLAALTVVWWQAFDLGYQMGGDVARRDARAEARAAAPI